MQDDASLGPARLLVHFSNSSVDALSLVPAVLRPFVTRLLLQSSSLQLLTFDNSEVLQEAIKYIQADPSERVRHMSASVQASPVETCMITAVPASELCPEHGTQT